MTAVSSKLKVTVSVAETALVNPVPPAKVNVSPFEIVCVAAPSPVMSKVVDPPPEVLVIVIPPAALVILIPVPAVRVDFDKVCYGYKTVCAAIEQVAVKNLLISDHLFRSRNITIRK